MGRWDRGGDDNRRWIDVMQVCEDGHMITSSAKERPQDLERFCTQCGAPTMTSCKECKAEIPGYEHIPMVAHMGPSEPPEFCKNCGKPYPWTGKKKDLTPRLGAVEKVQNVLSRFHVVARQLQHRHENRSTLEIDDEYDVQDLLHALLKVHFDDVRPEEWCPSHAGGSTRMDFLIKAEAIVIEAKKTRRGLGSKEVGAELLIDIGRYRSHPECTTLVCFVYDPEGKIGNPAGLKRDLESHASKDLDVRVFIFPKTT